jgi:hypothetical protein
MRANYWVLDFKWCILILVIKIQAKKMFKVISISKTINKFSKNSKNKSKLKQSHDQEQLFFEPKFIHISG